MIGKIRLKWAIVFVAVFYSVTAWAGFGTLNVKSSLGQPFSAEMEFTSDSVSDVDSIQVSLADEDAFKAMGVDYSALLSYLHFSKRLTSHGILVRVSTRIPIEDPYLQFVVQVKTPSGNMFKQFTALLDPAKPSAKSHTDSPSVAPSLITDDVPSFGNVSNVTRSPEVSHLKHELMAANRRIATLNTQLDKIHQQLAVISAGITVIKPADESARVVPPSVAIKYSSENKVSPSIALAQHTAMVVPKHNNDPNISTLLVRIGLAGNHFELIVACLLLVVMGYASSSLQWVRIRNSHIPILDLPRKVLRIYSRYRLIAVGLPKITYQKLFVILKAVWRTRVGDSCRQLLKPDFYIGLIRAIQSKVPSLNLVSAIHALLAFRLLLFARQYSSIGPPKVEQRPSHAYVMRYLIYDICRCLNRWLIVLLHRWIVFQIQLKAKRVLQWVIAVISEPMLFSKNTLFTRLKNIADLCLRYIDLCFELLWVKQYLRNQDKNDSRFNKLNSIFDSAVMQTYVSHTVLYCSAVFKQCRIKSYQYKIIIFELIVVPGSLRVVAVSLLKRQQRIFSAHAPPPLSP